MRNAHRLLRPVFKRRTWEQARLDCSETKGIRCRALPALKLASPGTTPASTTYTFQLAPRPAGECKISRSTFGAPAGYPHRARSPPDRAGSPAR